MERNPRRVGGVSRVTYPEPSLVVQTQEIAVRSSLKVFERTHGQLSLAFMNIKATHCR